jgi:hypothetical protein
LYLPPIIVVYSNDIIRLLVLPPFVPKVSKMDVFIYIYTRQGNTSIIEAPFLWSGCGRVVYGARLTAKRLVLQCINGVSSNPIEGRKKI